MERPGASPHADQGAKEPSKTGDAIDQATSPAASLSRRHCNVGCQLMYAEFRENQNISIFGDSGRRIKHRDEDKILGRNEKYMNCIGKLNAKPGK